MNKNVVITGIGIVSPIGIGKKDFFENLFVGKSAFKPITLFDTKDLKVNTAGEIADFNPKQILTGKIGDFDRATRLLLCAVKFCLDDSGYQINEANTHKTAICAGTTFGSLASVSKFDQSALTDGPRFVNPSLFPSTVGNSAASRAAIMFKIKGANATISSGMSAGLDALDYACDQIALGKYPSVLCCGLEDLAYQIFLGFYKLNYLAGIKGEFISCPFDKRRNGIVLSEGAVTFLLEDEASAKSADRKIYAKVLGIGASFDPAKFYMYNPKGEGMKTSMMAALTDAGLTAKDIDCVFASANSTKDGDLIESKSLNEVFKDNPDVPVTAIKSVIGETYSASGSFALAAAIGALEVGGIPATINSDIHNSDCRINLITKPLSKSLKTIMINAFGPDGANTSVIVGRP